MQVCLYHVNSDQRLQALKCIGYVQLVNWCSSNGPCNLKLGVQLLMCPYIARASDLEKKRRPKVPFADSLMPEARHSA